MTTATRRARRRRHRARASRPWATGPSTCRCAAAAWPRSSRPSTRGGSAPPRRAPGGPGGRGRRHGGRRPASLRSARASLRIRGGRQRAVGASTAPSSSPPGGVTTSAPRSTPAADARRGRSSRPPSLRAPATRRLGRRRPRRPRRPHPRRPRRLRFKPPPAHGVGARAALGLGRPHLAPRPARRFRSPRASTTASSPRTCACSRASSPWSTCSLRAGRVLHPAPAPRSTLIPARAGRASGPRAAATSRRFCPTGGAPPLFRRAWAAVEGSVTGPWLRASSAPRATSPRPAATSPPTRAPAARAAAADLRHRRPAAPRRVAAPRARGPRRQREPALPAPARPPARRPVSLTATARARSCRLGADVGEFRTSALRQAGLTDPLVARVARSAPGPRRAAPRSARCPSSPTR